MPPIEVNPILFIPNQNEQMLSRESSIAPLKGGSMQSQESSKMQKQGIIKGFDYLSSLIFLRLHTRDKRRLKRIYILVRLVIYI